MLEKYLLLFVDSFVSNLSFILDEEFVIISMLKFGSYNNLLIIGTVTIAFFLASCVNYYIGKAILEILASDETKLIFKKDPNLSTIVFATIYILSAVPFWGKFIALFCGIRGLKFQQIILWSMLCKMIYYVLYVYVSFN